MTVPAIGLTITTAGLTRFTQAQEGEPVDLTVSTVAYGGQPFVVAPTLTAVPGEIKRIATIAGEVLDDSIVHLIIRDDTADTYQVYGLGLYLADGTLFAVFGQETPMLEKSSQTALIAALDLKFPAVDVSSISFGDSSFVNPPASEDTKGIAAIASQPMVDAGTDDETIVTPLKLAVRLTAALSGLVAGIFASAAETIAGAISNKAVHPAGLKAALDDRLGAGAPTGFIKTLLAAATAVNGRATLGLGNVSTLNAASAAELLAATAGDKLVTPGNFGALGHRLDATTGEYIYPGGFRMKWLHASVGGDQETTIDFATPFPNACVFAVCTGGNASNTQQDNGPFVRVSFAVDHVKIWNSIDTSQGLIDVAIAAWGF